ncbi:MAG: DUF4178 domain-containing protein [Planctomycetota bacterium]|jgi:hypothetical protein
MIYLALGGLTWFILIVLVVALVVIVQKYSKSRKNKKGGRTPPPLPEDLSDDTVKDARVGDIVSISGFGDEYDDVDFVIKRRNRYESGGYEWYELLGEYKGRQVWIDWEEDDALEITATSPDRELRLSQLNITEEDLARMDEEESTDNFIEWDGQKFYYSESCEAGYFKDCAGPGEGFYLWDFEGEDGETFLAIEKWEGEPFSVFTGKTIRPFNVKVFKR